MTIVEVRPGRSASRSSKVLLPVAVALAVILSASGWDIWFYEPAEGDDPFGPASDFWIAPAPGLDASDVPSSIPWATSSTEGSTGLQVEEGPRVLSHLREVEGKQEFPNMWPYFSGESDDTPSYPFVYPTGLTIGPAAAEGDGNPAPASVGMSETDGSVHCLLLREGGLTVFGLEDRSSPRVLSSGTWTARVTPPST